MARSKHRGVRHFGVPCVAALLIVSSGRIALAQEQTPDQGQGQAPDQTQDANQDRGQGQRRVLSRDQMQEAAPVAPEVAQPAGHRADGKRHADLPVEAYAVVPGTKFLVRLDDELDTKETRERKHFKVTTLEPLEAGSGMYLPPGAQIHGHVSRVESAGVAGRAKIWLTFDDIHTKFATLPIVAEVVSVPGDHSVRTGSAQKEGLIEGRTSTQQAAAEAAAAGAAMGAVRGVKDKDKREAVEGAAAAALAAYLMESGRGHEIDLPKGAKLELELERALYLLKE
jgi:hypothetical protein